MKKFGFKNILLVISLIANIFLIAYIYNDLTTSPSESYPFLSPRIFADKQNDILINFIPLRTKLIEYASPLASQSGIYFEYLPSGISIGVGEKNQFVLASLLKVPLIMGVYREIEKGKMNMDQVLTVQDDDIDPFFGDLWRKGPGTQITVREAIFLTLTQSDNTAKSVLFHNVPGGTIEDVFNALDIPEQLDNNQTVVTAKNYSSVLRSLYLSSYVNKHDANEILQQLSQSIFKDKLPAGVPKDIKVAHKIGVFDPAHPDKSIYTDCGIVYVPKRPYILCLMMQNSEDKVRLYMKTISKMVYDYVSKTNLK